MKFTHFDDDGNVIESLEFSLDEFLDDDTKHARKARDMVRRAAEDSVCPGCKQCHPETVKHISEFELIDHGSEHSQYFQGCGVAFTSFENVTTGIGDNPAEAIDDCLEQVAQAGFETEGMEARIMEQEGWEKLPLTPSVAQIYKCEELPEVHYHVSVRWNEKK